MKKGSVTKFIILVFIMLILLALVEDAWNSEIPLLALGCGIGALLCLVAAINYGFPRILERLFEEKNNIQTKKLKDTIEKQRKEIEALKKERDDWGSF